MRPSTRELINAVVIALEQQVAPAVQGDKWAASVLRSTQQLLNHVAQRTEREIPVLLEDNSDARAVLEAIAPLLANKPAAEHLYTSALTALNAPDPAEYDAAGMDLRNEAYQTAIEQLVKHRDVLHGATGSEVSYKTLCAYLKRRLEREQHLYFPGFLGPPF